jgi:hypothetical protein
MCHLLLGDSGDSLLISYNGKIKVILTFGPLEMLEPSSINNTGLYRWSLLLIEWIKTANQNHPVYWKSCLLNEMYLLVGKRTYKILIIVYFIILWTTHLKDGKGPEQAYVRNA